MQDSSEQQVRFDLLVKAPGSGQEASLTTIDRHRPKSEHVERCRRWLVSLGVECYATDFGLAGSMPPPLFESVFRCKLHRIDAGPGLPLWEASPPPQAPHKIEHLVHQVTIGAEPEQF
ncbi:MAG: hypothetical protein KAW61_08215 [candidate division Zixibacteria bacterium]|nr:hypothetical protein [candidate division Zixibacteria bacterium]